MIGPLDPLRIDKGPQAFCNAYTSLVRPVRIEHAAAYWDFALSGSEEAHDAIQAAEEAISDLHSDPAAYEALCRWCEEGSDNPPLLRQLQLLRLEHRQAQIEVGLRKEIIRRSLKIEETYTLFRPELDGRRVSGNQLDRILRDESDPSLRRAAWEATRAIGRKVAHRVVELVKLRNEQGRALGFSDYYALAVDDEEMEPETLFALLNGLRDQTDAAWVERKGAFDLELASVRGKTPGELMPWDYPERFLQSLPRQHSGAQTDAYFTLTTIPRLCKSTFRKLGLPIESLWEASDMLPRDGKFPHAFCIGIDNPGDVRVLCNLDSSTRWMETSLHEFGHAVYNAGIDPELPWLLREAAHTFITEAVAMYFGRLARSKHWLRNEVQVKPELAERSGDLLAEAQMVFVRWALVVANFERAMYADPNQDLNALWWSYVERLQGLRRPEGWNGPDWASKVHVACYPAYYQNYILAELLASQFSVSMSEQGVSEEKGGSDLGVFFKDLFAAGRMHRWDACVELRTGARLSPEPWIRQFVGKP